MKTPKLISAFAVIVFFSFLALNSHCQEKIPTLEEKLDSLTRDIPALNQRITISVSNVSIHEFIRAIANSSGLNINVDPGLNIMVVNNFTDVRVMDILLFLARDYHLDISIIGNIITVYQAPLTDRELNARNVRFDTINNTVTLNYREYNLQLAAKEITETTGKNVILSPGLEGVQVNGFIQDMPFENALEKFAFSNSMTLEKTGDDFYILSRSIPGLNEAQNREQQQFQSQYANNGGTYTLETNVYSFDSIQINASNAPIELLVKDISDKLGISYFISSPIAGNTTLNINGVDYKEFLSYIFSGTPNTYIYNNNLYIFSGSDNFEVKDYRVIKLRYRSVNKLLEVFPESLKMGIELKEFPEMNSLMIGGGTAQVNVVENFIKQIDKTVPVILIEVMIVYMNHSYTVATGIEAGLGDKQVETTGRVFPEVNIQLGSESINNLLNSFNGFGSLNIGKVTPNFYLNLKALESQGIIDITSTPKLSTLNGHPATMSIGNTEYYIEERTDLYGAQNPQLTTTNTYQAVEAELSLNINPIVSGDNQITLEIEVNQSDFTSRISEYAPPGKMSRKFKSMIRVGDQEMVLLGGLEEKRKNDTSNGVPLLSRIPVLKWIFSSRTKINTGTRLNFFIKPTIIG